MRCKLLFLVTLVLSCFQLKAEEQDTEPDIEIVNIDFDYTLVPPNIYVPSSDASGTLYIEAKVSSNIEYVIFKRTFVHLKTDEKLQFVQKSRYNVSDNNSTIKITKKYASWGMYFQLDAVAFSGDITSTPLFCSNDYISPEDLEKIMNNASVEDIETDDINITFKSNVLTVDASSEVQISVYDLTGRILFNGNVSQYTEIPLSANLIIVKYTTKDQTVTKKFISK